MKLFYLTLFFFLFTLFVPKGFLYGQQPESALKRGPSIIPEAYDRSSLSWILVYDGGDSYTDKIKEAFAKIDHTDKFFMNPLEDDVLRFSGSRPATAGGINRDVIKRKVEEHNFSSEIISYWYSRTDDGFMDMERIHQRGMENATDADVLRHQSTTRGNIALMDYGNRLIDKSYIVALDFGNVSKVKTDTYEGYRATVSATLLRVQLSEDDKIRIYDAWVVEGDSHEEAQKKIELFNTVNPPVVFVTRISTNVNSYNYDESTVLGRITPQRTDKELFERLIQSGYNDVLFELERNYDDFNVITPLTSTRPLGAPIGKREGLKVDQRFFVYEHRYDSRTKGIKEVRRGVIRATSDIADNRGIATGESNPSRFYQVAGRRLEQGYVLQQNNDYGIGINLGAAIGHIGGGSFGLDYSIGRAIGIPAVYLSGNAGLNMKPYNISPENPSGNVSFFRWDVGLVRGIHFFRNFELRLYLAYGQEQANNNNFDNYEEISTHFIKGGANLALNITYGIQIVGGYNFYSMIGNAFEDEDTLPNVYTYYFPNREGGSIFAGLRFKF